MLEISDHGFVQEAKSVLNIRSRRTLAENSLNISCVGLVVASSYFNSYELRFLHLFEKEDITHCVRPEGLNKKLKF